jgi:hypothetical protein
MTVPSFRLKQSETEESQPKEKNRFLDCARNDGEERHNELIIMARPAKPKEQGK